MSGVKSLLMPMFVVLMVNASISSQTLSSFRANQDWDKVHKRSYKEKEHVEQVRQRGVPRGESVLEPKVVVDHPKVTEDPVIGPTSSAATTTTMTRMHAKPVGGATFRGAETTPTPFTDSSTSSGLPVFPRGQMAKMQKQWQEFLADHSMPKIECTSEKEVCLPANYSRFQLPNRGKVTVVSIGFDGFDVRKIDDIEYTVEISCYFLTKWRDDRLMLHENIRQGLDPSDTDDEEQWYPIDLEFVDKLWLPDVEVLNLKTFNALDVLSKLQGLWVSQYSNILYVLATRITFICAMSFDAFPLDVQTCMLQVGSFNFDNRKMVFDSYLLPVMPNHTKSILDYDVTIKDLRPEATFFVPAQTGNYSVTGFEMILTRRMSHYMITYYLPSSLFVVVSWTSFLIPSEDIQGRMALLVTLFLVLVNIFNTTTTNSPKADGLNAMQSWVICCIFFVFGALFEYAIILLQMKVKTFKKLSTPLQKDETCRLDMAVLIAFPIVFLIFNIAYWMAFHL